MSLLAYLQIDPSFVNILDAYYDICASKLLPNGLKVFLRCFENWGFSNHITLVY